MARCWCMSSGASGARSSRDRRTLARLPARLPALVSRPPAGASLDQIAPVGAVGFHIFVPRRPGMPAPATKTSADDYSNSRAPRRRHAFDCHRVPGRVMGIGGRPCTHLLTRHAHALAHRVRTVPSAFSLHLPPSRSSAQTARQPRKESQGYGRPQRSCRRLPRS
jgi:hypothetical protein